MLSKSVYNLANGVKTQGKENVPKLGENTFKSIFSENPTRLIEQHFGKTVEPKRVQSASVQKVKAKKVVDRNLPQLTLDSEADLKSVINFIIDNRIYKNEDTDKLKADLLAKYPNDTEHVNSVLERIEIEFGL